MKLLGSVAKQALAHTLQSRLSEFPRKSVCLSLFRIGDKSNDGVYLKEIIRTAKQFGIQTRLREFPSDAAMDAVKAALLRDANDPDVHGILFMRPLPEVWEQKELLSLIPAEKDVDGIRFFEGGFAPCAAASCLHLLDAYGISVSGKQVAVIGRSDLVGRPLVQLLEQRNALVTVCHSQTERAWEQTKKADVLFVACGVPRMVDDRYVHSKQVVVDVGFHVTDDGITGDVDYGEVFPKVAALTPVPGGIGTITVMTLLLHTVTAYERRPE